MDRKESGWVNYLLLRRLEGVVHNICEGTRKSAFSVTALFGFRPPVALGRAKVGILWVLELSWGNARAVGTPVYVTSNDYDLQHRSHSVRKMLLPSGQ